jgi:MFS family permease
MLGATNGPGDVSIIEVGVRWLLTPLSGSGDHSISMAIAWHGRLMVLGMAILMPPIILVARFFKITPRQNWPRQLDNPFWFVTHQRWGHLCGLIVIVALAFALVAAGWQTPWHSTHVALGWSVIALVFVQVIGAWLRGTHGGPVDPFTRQRRPPQEWPGDHFSMTRRRIAFEYIHKYAGYVLFGLTIVAILTGLVAADSPRWMPIVIGIWWLLMLGVFAWLQHAGRCIDTYQAIWGLDPELPGNRRRPVGFGVSRKSGFAPASRD